MSARRYAEGTTVSEDRSRAELEQLLRRHGAFNVITAAHDDPPGAVVQFMLAARLVRFVRPFATFPTQRAALAERRRCWRVLILWAKARLEMIASGDSTAEAEFLPWIALPNGLSVGKWLEPQIAQAYSAGQMPQALLPAPGERR